MSKVEFAKGVSAANATLEEISQRSERDARRSDEGLYGAIEAGGTKWVCAVGRGPEDIESITIPTRAPQQTMGEAIAYFRERAGDRLRALGIGSFGPVDLRHDSATYGCITSTPKAGWRDCEVAGAFRRALQVPIGFDTDVNAAALGEARWGAARDLPDFLYITVGTGIGGGVMANHRLLHGLMHTELGHIPIPRDRDRDPYAGLCPYHGDCLEGLASGPAIRARWGKAANELPEEHPAWDLEARYLALGLACWVYSLSPMRIVLGGGVMRQKHLFPRIRRELRSLVNGYIRAREVEGAIDSYVVPAALDERAGILGALVLAEEAYS